jgi:hypothetical protein
MRLADRLFTLDESVRNLHIKIAVLQFLRPAPYRRSRFLRNKPDDQQTQGAAFPGRAWRKVAGQCGRVRSRDRHGAFEKRSRRY